MRFLFTLLVFVCASTVNSQDIKTVTKDLKLVFSEGFSEKSFERFDFADSSQWLMTKNGKQGKDLKCLGGKGDIAKTILPAQMALLKDIEADEFVMDFDFMQRGKDFTLRDICVVFGYSDANNYSFVQAASEEGQHTHNVFVVENGRPRKIGKCLNKGVVWAYEKWHNISLVRQPNQKTLKLYIDGQLVIETESDLGNSGKLGLATFGSEFKVDNLRVWVTPNEK